MSLVFLGGRNELADDDLQLLFQRALVCAVGGCPGCIGNSSLGGQLTHECHIVCEDTAKVEYNGATDDLEHIGLVLGLSVLELHIDLEYLRSYQTVGLGCPALHNSSQLKKRSSLALGALCQTSVDAVQREGVTHAGVVVQLVLVVLGARKDTNVELNGGDGCLGYTGSDEHTATGLPDIVVRAVGLDLTVVGINALLGEPRAQLTNKAYGLEGAVVVGDLQNGSVVGVLDQTKVRAGVQRVDQVADGSHP